MPGTPNKRRKREAQAAAAATLPDTAPQPTVIPDAVPSRARAHDARTRARPTPPTPTRAPAMGRVTHATVDEQTARAVKGLAAFIKPGLTLRLSRTRPTWAQGYIEDYPVNDGESLSAFYEYVRDTHGGQTYKVEVLGAGDVQMFEGGITIAGPVRVDGRIVSRGRFEGRDDDEQRARFEQRALERLRAEPRDNGETMTFAKMLIDAQRESTQAQLAQVSKMVADTRAQTTELLGALAQRDASAKPDTFVQQLASIVDASTALDNVRTRLAPKQERTRRANAEDDDMKLFASEAKKVFMRGVAEHFVAPAVSPSGGRQAPPATPAARPVPRQNRAASPGFIPDAQSAGQPHAKN